MTTQHLKVKSKATLGDVISQLAHLVASLKKGKLCIRKNDEMIALKPQDPVALHLEAEADLGKESLREKLVIELKWKKGGKAPVKGDSFTINHLAPKFKL